MLRLAADENFNGDIVRGLLRRNPLVDIVRVQDVGLSGANDPAVLEWAATENRVVVTHDISTLASHAFARVSAGHPMPGVFAVPSLASIRRTIDDLLLLTECSHEGEWVVWQLHKILEALPSVLLTDPDDRRDERVLGATERACVIGPSCLNSSKIRPPGHSHSRGLSDSAGGREVNYHGSHSEG